MHNLHHLLHAAPRSGNSFIGGNGQPPLPVVASNIDTVHQRGAARVLREQRAADDGPRTLRAAVREVARDSDWAEVV